MYTLVVWFALAGSPSGALTPVPVKQFSIYQDCLTAMAIIHARQDELKPAPRAFSCAKSNNSI